MKSLLLLGFYLLLFCSVSEVICAKPNEVLTDSTGIPKEQLFELVQFRDYLLRDKEEDLYKLRDMLKDWEAKGIKEYGQVYITLDVGLSKKFWGKTGDRFLKRVNKRLVDQEIDVVLTRSDIEVIGSMFEVLQLIHIGILKNEYPFVINRKTNFFKELDSYQIEEQDVVLEIGAGSGMFGLMLKLIHPDISIYLNELSVLKFLLIEEIIEAHSHKISTHELFPIKGKKKSTALETHIADKIIIRHTLHHFKKMEEMLNSIKQSMNSDSSLFIKESTSDLHGYEGDCKHKMTKNEILDLMSLHGFELKELIDLEGSFLFEYGLKN